MAVRPVVVVDLTSPSRPSRRVPPAILYNSSDTDTDEGDQRPGREPPMIDLTSQGRAQESSDSPTSSETDDSEEESLTEYVGRILRAEYLGNRPREASPDRSDEEDDLPEEPVRRDPHGSPLYASTWWEGAHSGLHFWRDATRVGCDSRHFECADGGSTLLPTPSVSISPLQLLPPFLKG